jgi:HSP20 family protein
MLTRDLMVPSLFSSRGRFGSFFDDFSMPQSSIQQTDKAVNVELAVPGFKENEVNVTLDGNLLKVEAQHKDDQHHEEKDSQGRIISRSKKWSSSRIYDSFRLPSGLNLGGMTKTVQDGKLQLSIPKLAITDRPAQQQPQAQQQQQQQQLQQQRPLYLTQWPPKVDTKEDSDGKHITYSVFLPGAMKENIRINIENSNLYLTIVEHGAGHAFNTCDTCSTQERRSDQWSRYSEEQRTREWPNYINNQCTRFNERSCVIRLPYGTTADDVSAKFENEQLQLCIEKKQHWGPVNIQ